MPAYVILTCEKTRNQTELDTCIVVESL